MPKLATNYLELYVYHPADKKFLLLKRASDKIFSNIWQIVTATVEIKETSKQTLIRELYEETKLKPSRLFIIPKIDSFYLEFNDSITLYPIFLAFVHKLDVIISEEHTEYRWADFNEAKKLLHWHKQVENIKLIQKYLDDKNLFEKLVEIKIND